MFGNTNGSILLKEIYYSDLNLIISSHQDINAPFIRLKFYDKDNNELEPSYEAGFGKEKGPLYHLSEINNTIKRAIIKIVPTLLSQEGKNDDTPLNDKAITVNFNTGEITSNSSEEK